MIKALIIEDEPLTANRLKRIVEKVNAEIKIIALLQTVRETVSWLKQNEEPDLYFMDIQLSDGLSFDIFSAVNITKPVIFTTAFDEYAIKAFKANGIDYLLKPIAETDIKLSLDRYTQYKVPIQVPNLQELLREISNRQFEYKSNFLVEWRDQLLSLSASEIAFFHLSNKMTHLVTMNKRIYVVASTMDLLEKEIDPTLFFRINRQFIVSRQCLKKIHLYFGNRLKLLLEPNPEQEAIVSRDRVPEFKAWLDR